MGQIVAWCCRWWCVGVGIGIGIGIGVGVGIGIGIGICIAGIGDAGWLFFVRTLKLAR